MRVNRSEGKAPQETQVPRKRSKWATDLSIVGVGLSVKSMAANNNT